MVGLSRCINKLRTADEAALLVRSGQTIASAGFVGASHPEALTAALERRFLRDAEPRDLTLVYAAGQGDGKTRGLNHLAHAGLIRRVVGGHWGLAPALGKMALRGDIEAYNFPQGVICQLYRDIAAGRPGCITHIGLGTFVDPLVAGGRLNDRTPSGLVERVDLGGRPWLWYKSFPIDVAFIRATAADPHGNLLSDEEAIIGEILPMAQAARNSGGIVIAQVKRILEQPALPQSVRVPGVLVDHIVVSSPHEHDQTFLESYNAGYGQPASCDAADEPTTPLPDDERRLIVARACDELPVGAIANLGIGMPEGIARIAAERGMLRTVTLTVESGPIGGMPVGGLSFGASLRPEAIIDQPAQFDFYDGGGLDFAALGAAQIDRHGNVNVSCFGGRVAGVGGFVNISQTAKHLVFCSTFTSGGLRIAVEGGRLRILQEGATRKFVSDVDQISFNARVGHDAGQQVLFVTERAVFRPADGRLELIEVAPGIDIRSQILAHMDFEPLIRDVKPMRLHVASTVGAS